MQCVYYTDVHAYGHRHTKAHVSSEKYRCYSTPTIQIVTPFLPEEGSGWFLRIVDNQVTTEFYKYGGQHFNTQHRKVVKIHTFLQVQNSSGMEKYIPCLDDVKQIILILCSVDRASLYYPVNKSNWMHNST